MSDRNIGTHSCRSSAKRRCDSPRLFPKKVHITEEKVAQELGNLYISTRHVPSKAQRRANFLVNGIHCQKTFQELEESIEIDDVTQVGLDGAIELAPELAREIKKMSRRILTAGSYRPSTKCLPKSCQELVLWRPPSGALANILQAFHKDNLSQREEQSSQIKRTANTVIMENKLNSIKEMDSEIVFSQNSAFNLSTIQLHNPKMDENQYENNAYEKKFTNCMDEYSMEL